MSAVVVVGAGLSGLVCAWRLQRAGHDVEVLEASAGIGGRIAVPGPGERRIAQRASVIHRGDRNLHALVASLGLGDRLRQPEQGGGALVVGARVVPFEPGDAVGLLRARGLSHRARFRWLQWSARLRGQSSPLRSEHLTGLDREIAAPYLERAIGSELRDRVLGPWLEARLACELEEISAAGALIALREGLAAGPPRTFAGGLSALVTRLGDRVPVRRRCRVHRVETQAGGARVHFEAAGRARQVLADAVVMAVSASSLPALCPKLTPTERGFSESVVYGAGCELWLQLAPGTALPRAFSVALPKLPGVELHAVTIHRPEPGADDTGCVWQVRLREASARRLWEAPDDVVADDVVAQLARTPLGAVAVRGSSVSRWPRMLPRFVPGAGGRLRAFLQRADRSPRLAFAGDYLIGPSAESAVTSGMRAATSIVRQLEDHA